MASASSTPIKHKKYVEMSEPLYDEILAGIRKSYQHSCVLWIEDVKNDTLEEKFNELKEQLIEIRGNGVVHEKAVYHGTNELAARTIVQDGFDPSANKRSLYGKGSYFARDAGYSKNYAPPSGRHDVSYLLICSMLTGTEGKYGKDEEVDTKVHDHSVDPTRTIFVTPYRYGAVPRYLVAFYKSV